MRFGSCTPLRTNGFFTPNWRFFLGKIPYGKETYQLYNWTTLQVWFVFQVCYVFMFVWREVHTLLDNGEVWRLIWPVFCSPSAAQFFSRVCGLWTKQTCSLYVPIAMTLIPYQYYPMYHRRDPHARFQGNPQKSDLFGFEQQINHQNKSWRRTKPWYMSQKTHLPKMTPERNKKPVALKLFFL